MGSKASKAAQEAKGEVEEEDLPYAQLRSLAKQSHYGVQDVKELYERFRKLAEASPDKNLVTAAQFKALLTECGFNVQSDVYLKRLFSAFDESHSNTLDFREFLLGMSAASRGSLKEKVHLSFEVYDVDGSGQIAKSDMADVMTAMDRQGMHILQLNGGDLSAVMDPDTRREQIREFVDEVFDEYDLTNSGTMTLVEYTRAVLKHPALVHYHADLEEEPSKLEVESMTSELTSQITPRETPSADMRLAAEDLKEVKKTGGPTPRRGSLLLGQQQLIGEMQEVMAIQSREINELKQSLREAQHKFLPTQAAWIKMGVRMNYATYDESTHTVTLKPAVSS